MTQKHTPEPVALYWASLFDKSLMIGTAALSAELRRLHAVEKQRDAIQRELAQVKAAMKAQADGLVKQLDMVLAALSECSCALNQFDPYDDIDALWQLKSDIDVDSVLKTARAAIASVNGGAA